MLELERFLIRKGFPEFRSVESRASIAEMFQREKRCGIYVLLFKNSDVYAGQALDVNRRYIQHRKNHDDICAITFVEASRIDLTEIEKELIFSLEFEGFRLRNVIFTSLPKGESDFDLIMPVADQILWSQDINYLAPDGPRVVDNILRHRQSRKYKSLIVKSHFQDLSKFLLSYSRVGLPIPRNSEISFWSISCLPSGMPKGFQIYCRMNIFWQEVMTVGRDLDGPFCTFHVALSPLVKRYGSRLERLGRTHPRAESWHHRYRPGGPDQIAITVNGFDASQRLLNDENIAKAIRLFNIRLMKKGPNAFARHHCMDLADIMVDSS